MSHEATIAAEQSSTVSPASVDVPSPEALTLEASATPETELVAGCSSETPPPASATAPNDTPHAPRPARRHAGGGYDPQLEWLILCGDSAMGASGTLAGVVSQIERGQVGGSGRLDATGSYVHPYTDLQIGAGVKGIGEVELHRYLSSAFSLLGPTTQLRLYKRYTAADARFRSDSGYGAKDRWVEGSDHREGQHSFYRTSVEHHLGAYAALAFELTPDPAKLLIACMEPDPIRKGKPNKAEKARRLKLVKESLALAHTADREAHEEWFAAKASVPGLRTFKDRTGRERNQTPDAAGLSLGAARVTENASRRSGIAVDRATFERAVDQALAGGEPAAAE